MVLKIRKFSWEGDQEEGEDQRCDAERLLVWEVGEERGEGQYHMQKRRG